MAENNKKRPIVEKLDKEMEDISKSLSSLGKGFSKLLGLGATASSVADELGEKAKGRLTDNKRLLLQNQKIVNDRFKTLTQELGLTKKLNSYQSAAANISEQLKQDAKRAIGDKKKLSEEEIKILKRQRRQLNIMGKIHDLNEAITEAMGEQATSLKNLGKSIKLYLFNPLTAVVALLAASVARVFTVDAALTAGARSAGALRSQFKGISDELEMSRGELLDFGVDLDTSGKIAGEIAKTQGIITTDIAEAAGKVAKFGAVLGFSEAESAKIFTDFQGILGVSADSVDEVLKLAQGMSAAAGVPLAGVLEEVRNMSEETAALFAGNPQQLLKATIEARGLGLSVDQITKSLSSVTDIQGMFNKQAELSALLGRRVNLLAVERLKFQGKTTEAVEELNRQLFKSTTAEGRLAEFREMDVITKEKVAAAANLTIKQQLASLELAKKRALLSTSEVKALDEERELQLRIAAQGKSLLDRITRIFSPLIDKALKFALDFTEGLDFTPMIQKLSDFLRSDFAMDVKSIFVSGIRILSDFFKSDTFASFKDSIIVGVKALSNFLKSDSFEGIKDKVVEGFKVALEITKKIFNFMKENPKLAIGLALGAGALIKGIKMLTGGGLGGIMKFAPMAMKALPAIAGLAGVIAGGFMAVKNIGTIFSEDKKTKDIDRTRAMGSMVGMGVGGTIGAIFGGPIGAAIGASIGGAIGQMDFGQKLIGNILSQDTINNMKDVVGMIKGMADAAIDAFMGAEGESIGSRIGKAIGAAFAAFDLVKAMKASLTITEDLLIIVGDIIGGVFGETGFGLKLSNAIRSGIDSVISYFATIPDRFKRLGLKLDLALTELTSFDISGFGVTKRIGATDEELEAKRAEVRKLDQEIQDRMNKRTLGAKSGAAGANADFSVNDAIIKPDGQVVRFNPDDTAVLTREGIAPDMSETNELLRQLIAQQGGEQPTIQLNIDGKKVGQAVASSRYRN